MVSLLITVASTSLCFLRSGITVFLFLQLRTLVVIHSFFFFYLQHHVSYHNLSELIPAMHPFVTFFLFPSSLPGPCIRLTYPIPGLFITISSLYFDLFLLLCPFTLPPELRNWITDLTTSLPWHPPPSPIMYIVKPKMSDPLPNSKIAQHHAYLQSSRTCLMDVLGSYLRYSSPAATPFVLYTSSLPCASIPVLPWHLQLNLWHWLLELHLPLILSEISPMGSLELYLCLNSRLPQVPQNPTSNPLTLGS